MEKEAIAPPLLQVPPAVIAPECAILYLETGQFRLGEHQLIFYVWLSGNRMTLIERVTSDEVIEAAYEWLCDRRQDYHHNNDIWQLRRWWTEKKPQLVAQLRSGIYRSSVFFLFLLFSIPIRGIGLCIIAVAALAALVVALVLAVLPGARMFGSLRCFSVAAM